MSITDELRQVAAKTEEANGRCGKLYRGDLDRIADRIDEEAKLLCRKAFDGGADYGSASMQYNCNAVAYDWEHWLKKNKSLFMPKPTVEDVLEEFAQMYIACNDKGTIAEYAAKLRLRGEG